MFLYHGGDDCILVVHMQDVYAGQKNAPLPGCNQSPPQSWGMNFLFVSLGIPGHWVQTHFENDCIRGRPSKRHDRTVEFHVGCGQWMVRPRFLEYLRSPRSYHLRWLTNPAFDLTTDLVSFPITTYIYIYKHKHFTCNKHVSTSCFFRNVQREICLVI